MGRIYIQIFLVLFFSTTAIGQVYPTGLSSDTVSIPYIFNGQSLDISFSVYKPSAYDSASSPLLIAIHGSGGTGSGTINNLIDIADRRNTLIIAPDFGLSSIQLAMGKHFDPIDWCSQEFPFTHIFKYLYHHVLNIEGRFSIPSYLIGFSSGGQMVTRYMFLRQAHVDSIPIQMAVSANPYFYTFPTDSFMGTPMHYGCGTLLLPRSANPCFGSDSLYSFFCNDYIIQYYNENYGILIGTADTQPLNDPGCPNAQGPNRYERAVNFFNFCDSNAINRSTSLQWGYAEVPAVGHNENLLYNSKNLPTDTSTIAERLLFDTPYHSVPSIGPIASFNADSTIIQVNDTVHFTNLSTNAINFIWDFGDSTNLNFSVNPYHVYTTPGLYSVRLSAIGTSGCSNWYQKKHYITVTNGVGIAEYSDRNILISPNPSTDIFELHGLRGNYISFDIHNFLGQFVCSGNLIEKESESLDLKYFSDGIYLLSLQSREGVFSTYKLVKN